MSKHKRILKHRSNVSLFSSIERKADQLRREAQKCKPPVKVGKSKLVSAILVGKVAPAVDTNAVEIQKWNALADGKTDVKVTADGKVKYARRYWHYKFTFETLDGRVKKTVDIRGKTEDDCIARLSDPKVKASVLGASAFQLFEPSGLAREKIYLYHGG